MNSSTGSPRSSFARDALVLIALCAVFLPALAFEFTFDDEAQVLEDRRVQGAGTLAELFTRPTWPGSLFRPLVTLSYRLTAMLAGMRPLPFHATNIVLHLAVAIVFYELIRGIFGRNRALIAAALFAAAPIHLEVIANVSYRTESLGALFGLLALWCAPCSLGGLVGSGFFLFLALMCKESSAAFAPLALMLFAYSAPRPRLFRGCLLALSLFAGGAAYGALRAAALAGAPSLAATTNFIDNPLLAEPSGTRWLHGLLLAGRYLHASIFSAVPHADYSFAQISPGVDWNSKRVWFDAALVLTALSYALSRVTLRRRDAIFGALFFLPLAITGNIVTPIGTAFAERLAYVPSMGVYGAAALFLGAVAAARVRYGILLVILGAYLAVDLRSIGAWHDNLALWQRETIVSPDSVRAHRNYATYLMLHGDLEPAAAHAEQALQILPSYLSAKVLLQRLDLRLGKFEDAERILGELLAENPSSSVALDGMGWLRVRQARFPEAEHLFRAALRVDPRLEASQIGLFAALAREGMQAEADALEKTFTAAMRRDPRYQEFAKP
jgi:tetratricopeptide (TPR) repeat protein